MEKYSALYLIIGILTGIFCFAGGILFYIYVLKPKEEPVNYIIPPKSNDNSLLLLKEINDNIEKQIPEGKLIDYRMTVTDKISVLYDKKDRGLNWIAFTLCNEGPNPVYFAVNEWERPEIPLEVGKCTSVSFNRRGAIKKIYFVCDKGKSTTVTIQGLK